MTTPSDYPPPRPPRFRKADVFHIDDYAELDKYACAVRVYSYIRFRFHLICSP